MSEPKNLRPAAAYYASLSTLADAARLLGESQRALAGEKPDTAVQYLAECADRIDTANEVMKWLRGSWEEVLEDLREEEREKYDRAP